MSQSYFRIANISCILFLIANLQVPLNHLQSQSLSPEAATIWDAYFPDGAHNADADRLGGVIPTIGYSHEATSQSFYFQQEVTDLTPGIAELHDRGIKYYMFLEFPVLEVDHDSIVATDPLITDTLFGAQIGIDGNPMWLGQQIARSAIRQEWRDFIIRCIKRGIDAGSDGIQFDLAYYQFTNSFDPEDVAAFPAFMTANYPSSTWTSEGVGDIDTLDYRDWLYNDKGYTSFPGTMDFPDGDPPLGREWMYFKFQRLQQAWQIISDSTKAYAMTNYGKDFTIVGNNPFFGRFQQHGALTMGDRAGEYFDFTSGYPLTGNTTGLHKAVQGSGKRHLLWTLPKGDGVCNCDNNEFDQHMVAESFASGGLAQFAGEKAAFEPYFYLVQRQRDLLNSMNQHGEVGVMLAMPTTVLAFDNAEYNYGAQMFMQDIGRSYEVVVGGTGTDLGWPDSLKLSDVTKYKMLVLHEAVRLTDNQITVMLDYAAQGGVLLVFGTGSAPGITGKLDEHGATRTHPVWEGFVTGSTRISTHGTGKIIFIKENNLASDGYCKAYWTLRGSTDVGDLGIAQDLRDSVRLFVDSILSYESGRLTMPMRVMMFRTEDTSSKTMLYHLVNADVDTTTRLHNTITNKTVVLSLIPQLAPDDSVSITFYDPGDAEGTYAGNFAVDTGGRVMVTVPSLFIWKWIKIGSASSAPLVQARNLKVNGSMQPFKLPSATDPILSWDITIGSQTGYELEIWDNPTYYGAAIFTTGWASGAVQSYQPPPGTASIGTTYISRLRVHNGAGDTSEWTVRPFHINSPPAAPDHPDQITSDVVTVDSIPFHWFESTDPEADTLWYFWELFTDSMISNLTDTSNLHLVHTSGLSQRDQNEPLDGIFDTLTTYYGVDNYGMWWKAFAYDGVDTSDASKFRRFTWDHVDDPPRPFSLLGMPNGISMLTNQMLNFDWEYNGDVDEGSMGLQGFNLEVAEDTGFSVGFSEIASVISPHFINPPPPFAPHKLYFWRIKAIDDQTNQEVYSNQIFRFYLDDGSNQFPSEVSLVNPGNGSVVDSTAIFEWSLSSDADGDSIYYALELDTVNGFPSPIVIELDISDDVGPLASFPLLSLSNVNLLTEGQTYYWRVMAYDRFNGQSLFSDPTFSFVYSNCSVQAGFTSSGQDICVGDTLDFTNTSSGATSYLWQENSSTFSTGVNSSYSFNTAGLYTISLIAGESICIDTSELAVTVISPAESFFQFSDSGLTVQVKDSAFYADSILWTFGDGNTSTIGTTQHTYAADGSYVICLIAYSTCGNDTTCDTANVLITGLSAISENGHLVLFPNPPVKFLNIGLPDNFSAPDEILLSIYNSLGKLIYDQALTGNSTFLDVSRWPKGIYFSEVRSADYRARGIFVVQ